MPSDGEREFIGALTMIVGLLFWLGGAGYVSWWLAFLDDAWSEWIGKILMAVGALIVVTALLEPTGGDATRPPARKRSRRFSILPKRQR